LHHSTFYECLLCKLFVGMWLFVIADQAAEINEVGFGQRPSVCLECLADRIVITLVSCLTYPKSMYRR
jgi:hypothetical protein